MRRASQLLSSLEPLTSETIMISVRLSDPVPVELTNRAYRSLQQHDTPPPIGGRPSSFLAYRHESRMQKQCILLSNLHRARAFPFRGIPFLTLWCPRSQQKLLWELGEELSMPRFWPDILRRYISGRVALNPEGVLSINHALALYKGSGWGLILRLDVIDSLLQRS